jgi:hypothetical protein
MYAIVLSLSVVPGQCQGSFSFSGQFGYQPPIVYGGSSFLPGPQYGSQFGYFPGPQFAPPAAWGSSPWGPGFQRSFSLDVGGGRGFHLGRSVNYSPWGSSPWAGSPWGSSPWAQSAGRSPY